MKVYKVELSIIDFEEIGEEDIKIMLENTKYLHPKVISIDSREIGEWSDDHPLNHSSTQLNELKRIFENGNINEE